MNKPIAIMLKNILQEAACSVKDYRHIPNAANSFFHELLSYSAPYLFRGITSTKDIKLLKKGEVYYLPAKFFHKGIISNYTMALLLCHHTTLVFHHLEKKASLFYNLYNELLKHHHLLTHFNFYWTPSNCYGPGAHTDDHDVLVVQLTGKKYWKLSSEEVTLNAGDILYLKKGILHDPITDSTSDSLHLTIGMIESSNQSKHFTIPRKTHNNVFHYNALAFIKNMGTLFNSQYKSFQLRIDGRRKESGSHISFYHGDNSLKLGRDIYHHLFQPSLSTSQIKFRPEVDRNHAMNIILSFYRSGVPFTIEGSSLYVETYD